MGVRIVDDTTGAVLGSGWDEVMVVMDNQTRIDRSNRLIARAKQSADSISKLQRRLDGQKGEHGKILAKLAENLPTGMAVSFDENGTPVALVEQTPESAPAEQTPTE